MKAQVYEEKKNYRSAAKSTIGMDNYNLKSGMVELVTETKILFYFGLLQNSSLVTKMDKRFALSYKHAAKNIQLQSL